MSVASKVKFSSIKGHSFSLGEKGHQHFFPPSSLGMWLIGQGLHSFTPPALYGQKVQPWYSRPRILRVTLPWPQLIYRVEVPYSMKTRGRYLPPGPRAVAQDFAQEEEILLKNVSSFSMRISELSNFSGYSFHTHNSF